MIIHPSNAVNKIVIVLVLISICSACVFLYAFKSIVSSSVIFLIIASLALRFWIAYGRTVIIDECGVTVKLLGKRKTVRWDKVQQIRIYDSSNAIGYKNVAFSGAEFICEGRCRPSFFSPTYYCFWAHPWSYVFTSFSEGVLQLSDSQYPVFYEVEKDRLLTLFTKLNVSKKLFYQVV